MTAAETIPTAPVAAFHLERPDGVSDGAWTNRCNAAFRVITGHMPWCVEHYDGGDADGGWCINERTLVDGDTFARVTLHNGSFSGMTQICVDLKNPEGDLTVWQAGLLAHAIDDLAAAGRASNAAILRPSEVEDR